MKYETFLFSRTLHRDYVSGFPFIKDKFMDASWIDSKWSDQEKDYFYVQQ